MGAEALGEGGTAVDQKQALNLQDKNGDMSLLDVGVRIGELVHASNLCLNNKLPSAALSLMYIAFDTAASLDYRLRKERPRIRFMKWVERYILRSGNLPCSALDLYGARCGLLHTYSPRSHLSSKGNVAEIWYTFHDHEADMLREGARKSDLKQVVVLSLDSLTSAVTSGLTAFISDLESDQALAQWAQSKANETFQFVESVRGELRAFPTLQDLALSVERLHNNAKQSN